MSDGGSSFTPHDGPAFAQPRPEQLEFLATLFLALGGLVTLPLQPLALEGPMPRAAPRAAAPALRLAREGRALVPTQRHRAVRLDPASRALLSLLDGEHDEGAVVQALHARLLGGDLVAEQGERPLHGKAALLDVARRLYREGVARLWRQGLLVTRPHVGAGHQEFN